MSLNRQNGALELPTTATGETTLLSLDPALGILLGLLGTAIKTDLGPRWASARTGTCLADRLAVETTLDCEPSPALMREVKAEFPLLAVYRTGETEVTEFTMTVDRTTQRWGIDYVLGPLDAAGHRKLGAALQAVAKIVTEIVRVGGHPSYAIDDNDAGPKQVLIGDQDGCCHFSSVRIVNWSTGQADFASEGQSPTYWWMSMQLETTEDNSRTDDTLGLVDHTADWEYDLSDGDTSIDAFVAAEQLFED